MKILTILISILAISNLGISQERYAKFLGQIVEDSSYVRIKLKIANQEDLNQFLYQAENLSQIIELDIEYLGNDHMPALDYRISYLSNLEVLNLSYVDITYCLKELKSFNKLYSLGLIGCDMGKFHDEITLIKNLEYLFVAYDSIHTLPQTFTNLSRLKYIDITSCGLIGFPGVLCQMDSIEEILLYNFHKDGHKNTSEGEGWVLNNQINSLPECISQINTLEKISVPTHTDLSSIENALKAKGIKIKQKK